MCLIGSKRWLNESVSAFQAHSSIKSFFSTTLSGPNANNRNIRLQLRKRPPRKELLKHVRHCSWSPLTGYLEEGMENTQPICTSSCHASIYYLKGEGATFLLWRMWTSLVPLLEAQNPFDAKVPTFREMLTRNGCFTHTKGIYILR